MYGQDLGRRLGRSLYFESLNCLAMGLPSAKARHHLVLHRTGNDKQAPPTCIPTQDSNIDDLELQRLVKCGWRRGRVLLLAVLETLI